MNMHRNQLWLSFLSVVALVVLFYTGKTALGVYRYEQLQSERLPSNIEWSVKQKSNDLFFVKAHYKFQSNGSEYQGETLFRTPVFRNRWGAEQGVKEFEKKTWSVWYNSRSAAQSTLNKHFPLKETFYAATLWGLLIYFIWLGYYVGKKRTTDTSRRL